MNFQIVVLVNTKLKNLFNNHFEWAALAAGLLLMGLMNPYIDNGSSWCFFDMIGIPFCPGEGLGHSIAFSFRGDFTNAMKANIIGPFAIVVLIGRIGFLIKQNIISDKSEF